MIPVHISDVQYYPKNPDTAVDVVVDHSIISYDSKNKGFNIVDIDSYVSKHIISMGVLYPQNLGDSSDDFFCYAFLDQIIKDLQKSHELRVPNIFDVQKFL